MDGGDSSNRIGEEAATLNEGQHTDEEVDWEEVECEPDPTTVRILSSNGLRLSIQIELNSSVEDLKSAIARMTGWPVKRQRLIFGGRLMKNDQTLETYGIGNYHTVRLVTRPDAGAPDMYPKLTEAAGSRHDRRLGQMFFALNDPDELGRMHAAKNSTNKPNTPNTEPLPNPWAYTAKYGARRRS